LGGKELVRNLVEYPAINAFSFLANANDRQAKPHLTVENAATHA
jgi:hypothetical protein